MENNTAETKSLCSTLIEARPVIAASKACMTFSRFPLEVRKRIYEFVLEVDYKNPEVTEILDVETPSILHTSRQMRTEAAPMFYSTQVFQYTVEPDVYFRMVERPSNVTRRQLALTQWLNTIGVKQRKLIKAFTLRFDVCGKWASYNLLVRTGVTRLRGPSGVPDRAVMTALSGLADDGIEMDKIRRVEMRGYGVTRMGQGIGPWKVLE